MPRPYTHLFQEQLSALNNYSVLTQGVRGSIVDFRQSDIGIPDHDCQKEGKSEEGGELLWEEWRPRVATFTIKAKGICQTRPFIETAARIHLRRLKY